MPRGSPERTMARQEEIMNACESLYETMGFKEVTMKEIANVTSFTRPSIYNYFQTKEEIFLALFEREYERWIEELDRLQPAGDGAEMLAFADGIAHTLERRALLLKLLSANLHDMENNSRIERLAAFKRRYRASVEAVRRCLKRFCPDMEEQEQEEFVITFFPFIYGIYPYAEISKVQREAMRLAGFSHPDRTIYEIAYLGIRKLLQA